MADASWSASHPWSALRCQNATHAWMAGRPPDPNAGAWGLQTPKHMMEGPTQLTTHSSRSTSGDILRDTSLMSSLTSMAPCPHARVVLWYRMDRSQGSSTWQDQLAWEVLGVLPASARPWPLGRWVGVGRLAAVSCLSSGAGGGGESWVVIALMVSPATLTLHCCCCTPSCTGMRCGGGVALTAPSALRLPVSCAGSSAGICTGI